MIPTRIPTAPIKETTTSDPDEGFRVDILVEERLLVELKSIENFPPVHSRQVLTYLRLLGLPLGLLINFCAASFKQGIKRIVNNHQDFAASRLRGFA